MARKTLGDYSEKYLSKLSPAYANRIRRRREKYGPDAPIIGARGHKPKQTPAAVLRNQRPEERYTPEYLSGLSPKYRRQVERELSRSEATGQPVDMGYIGTYPKARARKMYYSWIAQTNLVPNLAYAPYSRAMAEIRDTVAPAFERGAEPDGRTFGEYFEDTWAIAKREGTTDFLLRLYELQYERAKTWRAMGQRNFRAEFDRLPLSTDTVIDEGASGTVPTRPSPEEPPAPVPATSTQRVEGPDYVISDEEGNVAVVINDTDLQGGEDIYARQPQTNQLLNALTDEFVQALPQFFNFYH